MARDYQFVGACPQLTREFVSWITDYDYDHGKTREITPRTFAKYADPDFIREWREQFPGHGILQDPFVGFYKSETPSGIPVVFFVWSAMEHVFVEPSRRFDLTRETALAKQLERR